MFDLLLYGVIHYKSFIIKRTISLKCEHICNVGNSGANFSTARLHEHQHENNLKNYFNDVEG